MNFELKMGFIIFAIFPLLFYPTVLQHIPFAGLEETEASFPPSGSKVKGGNTWQHSGVK
jgi:hypothetical protein